MGENNTGDISQEYNDFGEPVVMNPAPKKKRTGLIVGISIIAAAAAIIAVVCMILHKTPEVAVKLAIANTFGELKEADFSNYSDILGLEDGTLDNTDIVCDISVDQCDDEIGLEGASIYSVSSIEKNDNGIDFSALSEITLNDETLDVNIYQIEDVLYGEIPKIFNKGFSFQSEDFMGIISQATGKTGENQEAKALYDKYMKPAKDNLVKAVTYEKADSTKIVNSNGNKKRCKQYIVTIPSVAIKEYLTAFCEYMKEYAATCMADNIYDNMGISQAEFNSAIDLLPVYYALIFSKDIKVKVYVNKNKVVKAEADYKITMAGVDASFTAEFMGDDFVMNDVRIACGLSAESKKYEVVYTCKKSESGSGLLLESKAEILENGKSVSGISYNNKYNKDTGEYSDIINVNLDDENYCLDILGYISNIEKGKSFDMDIDHITFGDDDTEYISLSGKISYGELGEEVAEPDYDNIVGYDEVIKAGGFEKYLNEDEYDKLFDSWNELSSIKKTDGLEESKIGVKRTEEVDDKTDKDAADDEIEIEIPDNGEVDLSQILSESEESLDDYDIEIEELDDSDYESAILESGDYRVAINNPEGFERGYSDSDGITIYSDDINVYYYIYQDVNVNECCEEFLSTYEDVDECELISEGLETTKLSNGSDIQYYVMKLSYDDSNITDMYFFKPISDKKSDYVICNAEIWERDADAAATAELLTKDNVIEVQ